MIKIELVKFEAQDVITASGVHTHEWKKDGNPYKYNRQWWQNYDCECGEEKTEKVYF